MDKHEYILDYIHNPTECEAEQNETYAENIIENNDKIYTISTVLRDRLIKYAEMNHLPLCEYLDINNVCNFVSWITDSKTE